MRNVPTSSASRLSAARFRLKARSICSIAWERAADRITSAPGGRRRWTPARIESPAGPSGMMRSIRLSRPRRSSSSCALATSVSRRLSNACRLSGSAGSRSPATVTDRRVDPQAAVYLLGKAVRAADHLVAGAPRDALRREPEGSPRARVGEIDRDHDGYAERDAEDRQTRLPRVVEEPAEARAPEHYAP